MWLFNGAQTSLAAPVSIPSPLAHTGTPSFHRTPFYPHSLPQLLHAQGFPSTGCACSILTTATFSSFIPYKSPGLSGCNSGYHNSLVDSGGQRLSLRIAWASLGNIAKTPSKRSKHYTRPLLYVPTWSSPYIFSFHKPDLEWGRIPL